MNGMDWREHRLRVEWLRTRRARKCPKCDNSQAPKQCELKNTLWCTGCKKIWLIRKGKWFYENDPATRSQVSSY